MATHITLEEPKLDSETPSLGLPREKIDDCLSPGELAIGGGTDG